MKRGLYCLVCALSLSGNAFADAGDLAAAQRAYQEVDFERAYSLGREALERGQASRAQSLELYVLLATCAATLGHDDEARRYFSVALAMDPTRKLDRSLSPKIRGPYLEAAGSIALYPVPLALSAEENPAAQRLNVHLTDPLSLARKVLVQLRPLGEREFTQHGLSVEAETALPLAASLAERGFEYNVRALDEFGNALYELGSNADPVTVPAHPPAPVRVGATRVAPARVGPARTPWLAIGLGVAGLAAVGAGSYFQVRREEAAREWNGPGCEHAGSSRGAQCGDVDSERQRFQGLALGSFAAGGALLTGAVVSWLVGRDSRRASDSALLACGSLGSFVTCRGSF